MMGEGTVNDEELVEVIAEEHGDLFICWQQDSPTKQWTAVFAALRSAGFQMFKPEDCVIARCRQGRSLSRQVGPIKGSFPLGSYFLVPTESPKEESNE